MVTVTMRETYDLSTKVGKMGMISIHTPSMDLVSRMWSGLVQNHRKIKVEKCDIRMACASVLPADPLQVGVEAGDIAPQDMFNPILYTAVSNDSFGTLQTRLYTLGAFNNVQSASVGYDPDPIPNGDDSEGIYYAMLASQGWKKAMPQAGLEMRSLRPLVHTLQANHASSFIFNSENAKVNDIHSWVKGGDGDTEEVITDVPGAIFKGPTAPMPAIPTMYYSDSGQNTEMYGSTIQAKPTILPGTYVACILMPPAKLNVLYFRLSVKWYISFFEPRPNTEITNLNGLGWEGKNRFYYTDYNDQSKLMTEKTNLVDTLDVDIKQIM